MFDIKKGETKLKHKTGFQRCTIWCLMAGVIWGALGTVFTYYVIRGIML